MTVASTGAGLVYEHGQAESWVRCSLERTTQGVRVVLEGHHCQYKLEPTAHVLGGVTHALRNLTPDELMTGAARLGPVGAWVPERIGGRTG